MMACRLQARVMQPACVKAAMLLVAMSALAIFSALTPVAFSAISAPPSASVSPPSVSFGYQAVGATSAAQIVTLADTGSVPLSIASITITGTNASDFAQSNNCGSTLSAKASCTISVTFKPSGTGGRGAILTIWDNGRTGRQKVGLSGVGAIPTVKLSASSISFGNQLVGTSSAARTAVTLTDSSIVTLGISAVRITGANANDFAQSNNCGTSVAAGGNCTISITFTPSAGGSRTASISISDNGSGSPQTVGLSGTGVVPTAAATPTFSPVAGTYTSAQTVTISDATSGATVYYTTNGTTPTTSSTQYTRAITVSSNETLEAIAVASGYSTSAVASATYTINDPVPTATALSPSSATAGGAAFTLTVTGTNFVSGSVVQWNGSARTTALVSGTQLTAAILASDIATPGTDRKSTRLNSSHDLGSRMPSSA